MIDLIRLELLLPCDSIRITGHNELEQGEIQKAGHVYAAEGGNKEVIQASQESQMDEQIPDIELWIVCTFGAQFFLVQILLMHCFLSLEVKEATLFLIV